MFLLFGRISPGAKTDVSLPMPTESYILSMKTNNESLRYTSRPATATYDFWKPPPPDPMLDVPGELVLSLEKKGRTEYWPAKIEEYIPPPKRTAKSRYRLLFLGDAMLSVERSMFYMTGEDAFYSCKLEKFDSGDSKIADNVDADIDESELTRGPSPIPEIPPPTNFGKLSIRQQFSYVKPVVKAVLNDRYPPAKDRHDAFMKGGIIRRALRKEAPAQVESSGRVQPTADSTNAAVIPTHHQDARAQSVLSDLTEVVTPPPSEVTTCGEMLHSERTGHHEQERRRGCEAYEALTQLERIEYCQLVLLHESILQLLLWRSEERTSLKKLDDNEEKHLHEIAFKMSEQMDWVVEIERLREAGQKRRQQKVGPPPMSMSGTRSRPKMSSSAQELLRCQELHDDHKALVEIEREAQRFYGTTGKVCQSSIPTRLPFSAGASLIYTFFFRTMCLIVHSRGPRLVGVLRRQSTARVYLLSAPLWERIVLAIFTTCHAGHLDFATMCCTFTLTRTIHASRWMMEGPIGSFLIISNVSDSWTAASGPVYLLPPPFLLHPPSSEFPHHVTGFSPLLTACCIAEGTLVCTAASSSPASHASATKVLELKQHVV
ncbi:hypothetical protein EW146_g1614 [Bondarzewia mesenterica]|uniref:PWWP domain-containing protein n=1 Tax=Bondarzewia mesenterica TaxID=1095465 RepID=A0A4S4M9H5_9AGAM|nr:hypothetical protein EW146_g1614 [Bondarzewia mesenterica]